MSMAGAVRTQRRRPVFHPLTVARVDPLTEDAVAVTFTVPEGLRELFGFSAGQHVTLRRVPPGEDELRRSYSICSTPQALAEQGLLRIGVRQIDGGVFSTIATRELRAGDAVEVLPPLGHFTTAIAAHRRRHYAAIAAGSGITPVLSIVATALATEPESRFTVVYLNRRAATAMFAEDLAELKDRYLGRLHVIHVFSREPTPSALLSGRIDARRMRAILDSGLIDASAVDEWFLCGPYGMVMDVRGVLSERRVPDTAVRTELFHVADEPPPARARAAPPAQVEGEVTVTIRLDGRESTFAMRGDERVLDAALRARGELPYSCRGGVCSTCRARLVSGEVRMARNYALEPEDLAAGYVLTCQSEPASDRLLIDYDE